jgi:hypothetical protein
MRRPLPTIETAHAGESRLACESSVRELQRSVDAGCCIIFRLSTKLAAKLKVTTTKALPLDPDVIVDWSAHLFTAERVQFVLLTNTASLYSVVMHGRGIASERQFVDAALGSFREFMATDGLVSIYRQFIAPASDNVSFSKALNRSVTGSMNDLIVHARMWLTEGSLSTCDTSFQLNEIPFSALAYKHPRKVFTSLALSPDT